MVVVEFLTATRESSGIRISAQWEPKDFEEKRDKQSDSLRVPFCGTRVLECSRIEQQRFDRASLFPVSLLASRRTTARAASVMMRENAVGNGKWHLSSLAMDRYFAADGIQRVEVGKSVLQPGDMLAVDMLAGGPGFEFNADGIEQIAVVREGINLGVRVSTDFCRFQHPWVSRAETRSQVTIFRAARPTSIALK